MLKESDSAKKAIHTFHGHVKAVTCLEPVKDDHDLLMSAGLDSTVRIWSLDKFQQLYLLQVPTAGINYIRLYENGTKVLAQASSGSVVSTNSIHLVIKNYLAADADITSIMPCFDTVKDWMDHKVRFTISLCQDNSAFIQRPGAPGKCTLYPPPASQIAAVVHSIVLDRMIVMLGNCDFLVCKTGKETAVIDSTTK